MYRAVLYCVHILLDLPLLETLTLSIGSPTCRWWMPQSEVLCLEAPSLTYTWATGFQSNPPFRICCHFWIWVLYWRGFENVTGKKHVSFTGYKLPSQTSLTTKLVAKLYFTFSLSSIKTQTALLENNIFKSSMQ